MISKGIRTLSTAVISQPCDCRRLSARQPPKASLSNRIDLPSSVGDRQKPSPSTYRELPNTSGAHGDHSDEASPPGPFMSGNSPRQGEAHWHPRSSGGFRFRPVAAVALNNAVVVVVSLPLGHRLTLDSDQTANRSSTCPTLRSASSWPPCVGRCRQSVRRAPAFHIVGRTRCRPVGSR